MNPPATVIRQSSQKVVSVAITLAIFSLGFSGTAVKAQTIRSRGTVPQTDGTYLYGQTSQANQMSKGYVVFQRQKGKVVGAIYSPHSEFNCFTGSSTRDSFSTAVVRIVNFLETPET